MSTVSDGRQTLLKIKREIEGLALAGLSSEEFFDKFIGLLVRAVGARAGAVWMSAKSGGLELYCEKQLSETDIDAIPGALAANEQIVLQVMGDGQARVFADVPGQIKLPTGHPLIIAPLRTSKSSVGAVEIFQRPDAPAEALAGQFQFVEQMCGHACRYLEQRAKPQAAEAPADKVIRREQFLLRLYGSLISGEVAATAASDGRHVIGCDRVAIAIRRGRKDVVLAVSGQDSVNRRAKSVRLMEKLIASVIEMRKPLVYTGTVEDLAPQIENPLAAYIQESGARMVIVAPLLEPEPPTDGESATNRRRPRPRKLIGGLVAEQFQESQPMPGVEETAGIVVEHVSSALHKARTHERLLLTPFRRLVGSGRSLLEGRFMLKVAIVLAVVCAVGVALAVIPYEYRVEAKGRLMPVIQRAVFAPLDAEVVNVMVASAARVTQGQQLLQLRNDELHARLLAARNKQVDSQNRLLALQAELDHAVGKADRDEELRLGGEIVKATVEIEGAAEIAQLLEREEASLSVRAPIDGVVVTFQLDQLLKNRPVRRGELLVEVMDDTRPWRLELEIDEKRMGHVLRAIEKSQSEALSLEYVLATNVEATYEGRIERISKRADESETGNIVEILADVDVDELPNRQIGAEVIAKIECGERSLGYVLFGDVVEFVQRYLWL